MDSFYQKCTSWKRAKKFFQNAKVAQFELFLGCLYSVLHSPHPTCLQKLSLYCDKHFDFICSQKILFPTFRKNFFVDPNNFLNTLNISSCLPSAKTLLWIDTAISQYDNMEKKVSSGTWSICIFTSAFTFTFFHRNSSQYETSMPCQAQEIGWHLCNYYCHH